jgi:hypothetical protein
MREEEGDFSTLASTLNKEKAKTRKKAKKVLRPSAPSGVPLDFSICHKPFIFFWFHGGDDGARTGDLCRDRSAFRCNSLKLMSTDGEHKH